MTYVVTDNCVRCTWSVSTSAPSTAFCEGENMLVSIPTCASTAVSANPSVPKKRTFRTLTPNLLRG